MTDDRGQPPSRGRIAVVTGASGQIGRALCCELALAGNHVAALYGSDRAEAEMTEQAVAERGGSALVLRCDVRDEHSVDEAISQVEEAWGPPGIVVNNAGITRDTLLMAMTSDTWNDVINVNLGGTFQITRRTARGMVRARWGRIINIGSVAGILGSAGQTNYAAAKAGLVGLTRALARELASRNITCNLIAPGPIEAGLLQRVPQAQKERLFARVPMGRAGAPEDVATIAGFLASDAASYITGATIPVDGGLSMGG